MCYPKPYSHSMSEGGFVIAIGTVTPEVSSGTVLGLSPVSGNSFIPGKVIMERVQVHRQHETIFPPFLLELWISSNNLPSSGLLTYTAQLNTWSKDRNQTSKLCRCIELPLCSRFSLGH